MEKRADIVAMDSEGKQVKFVPVKTELGIKVISMNLLMEVEDDPVNLERTNGYRSIKPNV